MLHLSASDPHIV